MSSLGLPRFSRCLFSSSAKSGLFHPSIIEKVTNREIGERDTMEYRMFFDSMSDDSGNVSQYSDSNLSPWHDIPFGFRNGLKNDAIYFNYINEIPKFDRAKMECALNEKWNPIKQDIKKGALRYFNYGDLPFNYGFISQTYENPNHESQYSDIKGLMGDGDPIDVVEIGETSMTRGAIVPIKVLSVLGLIDEGETDWKIIGLRCDHPKCDEINSIAEADRILGTDYSGTVLDWFRNYKVCDGKPVNSFSHNESYQSKDMAIEIIEECHRHWKDLMLGVATMEEGKVDLTSVTHAHLMAQGSSNSIGAASSIEYPRYDLN